MNLDDADNQFEKSQKRKEDGIDIEKESLPCTASHISTKTRNKFVCPGFKSRLILISFLFLCQEVAFNLSEMRECWPNTVNRRRVTAVLR